MTLPCIFCNHRCRFDDWRKAYYCTPCLVHFEGREDYLFKTTFSVKTNKIRYELTIDVDANTTRLAYWDEYKGPFLGGAEPDILRTLIEIPNAMKGVTPQNAEDKVKTLLTYS